MRDQPFVTDQQSPSFSVCRVVTRPDMRGQGLCKKLMLALIEHCRQEGLTWIRLLVSPENKPAYRCYLSVGFRVIGECDLYDQHWHACELKL